MTYDLNDPHALEEMGAAVAVATLPVNWLVQERARHGGRAHGFIALKPLTMSGRQLQAGDIVAREEETPALERMIAHGDIAELPLDSGVLAIISAFRLRIATLESIVARETA